MKITKFVHSCLLVEMPDRTALFDPGILSIIDADALKWLDDIFITHRHADHMDIELIKRLQTKFPEVRITAPSDAAADLNNAGVIHVQTDAPAGVRFFDAPHEAIKPLFDFDPPQELGIHYLEKLSDPGDSHSFNETMPVLVLPVQAPWGSVVKTTELALKLKPQYVVPVHDWHWSDEARTQAYDTLEHVLSLQGIKFLKLQTGEPVVIEV
jgi:L-ascorbate metabolism protein UlaG (beta-lactamase superfamily)